MILLSIIVLWLDLLFFVFYPCSSKHPSGNVTATAKLTEAANRPRILSPGNLTPARSPIVLQQSTSTDQPSQPKPMKSFIDLTDDETDKPAASATKQPPALVAIPGQQKGATTNTTPTSTKNMTYVISNASNKQVVVPSVTSVGQTRITMQKLPVKNTTTGQYGKKLSMVVD